MGAVLQFFRGVASSMWGKAAALYSGITLAKLAGTFTLSRLGTVATVVLPTIVLNRLFGGDYNPSTTVMSKLPPLEFELYAQGTVIVGGSSQELSVVVTATAHRVNSESWQLVADVIDLTRDRGRKIYHAECLAYSGAADCPLGTVSNLAGLVRTFGPYQALQNFVNTKIGEWSLTELTDPSDDLWVAELHSTWEALRASSEYTIRKGPLETTMLSSFYINSAGSWFEELEKVLGQFRGLDDAFRAENLWDTHRISKADLMMIYAFKRLAKRVTL